MNNEYYCGLNNHGNTCFFNSALQNIFRCSVFINIISNLEIDHELIKIFKNTIEDYKKNSNNKLNMIFLKKPGDLFIQALQFDNELDSIIKNYIQERKRLSAFKNPDGNRSSTIFFQEIQELARIEIYLQ